MRQLVPVTALIALAAGPAFAAQDRYGPPRTAEAPSAYEARPEPLAPWARRLAPAASPEPQRPRGPEPLAPWAARAAAARPAPAPARLPPPADGPQPLALRSSAGQPAMRQAPPQTAQAPSGAAGPRFYSVSRQYGAQPDAIMVSPPARGESLSLAETPMTSPMSRGPAPLDDIPVSETNRNAAATRTARQGL